MNRNFGELQQNEVDKNFKVFQDKLEKKEIPQDCWGKFALMKNGEIIDYFSSWEDASKAGQIAYADNIFSIQEITDDIVDLGYYSHAFIQR